MTLNIILHIARTAQKQQAHHPQRCRAGLPAAGLQIADRKAHQRRHHRRQAQHLGYAHKAVAQEIGGVDPGGIQDRLGAAVIQAEQPEQVPGAAMIFPAAQEIHNQQHRQNHPSQNGLDGEGIEPVFHSPCGNTQDISAPEGAFRQNGPPVRGIGQAGKSSQGNGPGTCHAHGIQHSPQMAAPAQRRQNQRCQKNAGKGPRQKETAHAVVRQGCGQAFIGIPPEIPMGQSGPQHSKPQAQRQRPEAPQIVFLIPQI